MQKSWCKIMSCGLQLFTTVIGPLLTDHMVRFDTSNHSKRAVSDFGTEIGIPGNQIGNVRGPDFFRFNALFVQLSQQHKIGILR